MGINTTKYLLSAALLLSSLTAFSFSQPRRHLSPKTISGQRAAVAQRSSSFIGDKRQLVVLASFSDLEFRQEEPLTIWEPIFNQVNFKDSLHYGSVRDYFYDQSYGKFNLQFDLYDIKVNKEHAVYRSTATDDANAALLIIDLVDSLKNIVTDWAPYDWNNDGYVDQIFVLYAGMGQNNGGGSNTIWANQASLTIYDHDPITVSSNDTEYKINNYGCFPEYGTNSSSFGTLCHEFGHCLGLPDFYYNNYSILGDWDIMDNGNYNNDGYCPPCYSAHERMVLGWLDIKELTSPTSITDMPALCDEPIAYMIRNDNYPNEYYILENRQKKSWDQSLPSSGLVIFHIDYDEYLWIYDSPNNYTNNHYTIVPANNMSYTPVSYGWAYPFNGKDSLTNYSAPAATLRHAAKDGTNLLSKPITNIKVNDGLVSFDFMGGEQTAIQQTETEEHVTAVYDLHGRKIPVSHLKEGIYIFRYTNGNTKKVLWSPNKQVRL